MSEQLTYSIEDAAARLGSIFTVDWLKARVKDNTIPHVKTGKGTGRAGRVGFSEAHLAAIVAMFSVEPSAGTNPGDFTPLTRRRAVAS